MSILELKNVSKSFGEGGEKTEVLTNVDLAIEESEFVAIVGFSGSGKTTLINLIAGLVEPDTGEDQSNALALLAEDRPWIP